MAGDTSPRQLHEHAGVKVLRVAWCAHWTTITRGNVMNKVNRRASFLAALLAVVLVFGFAAGCGDNGGDTDTTQPSQTTAAPTETTAAPTESSATTSVTVSEPITLKMVGSSPTANQPTYILLEEWAQRVEQETAGKVKIEVYLGGTLVGLTEAFNAIDGGIADLANGPTGWDPARFATTSLAGNCLHRLPDGKVATAMLQEIIANVPELVSEWGGYRMLWVNGQTPGMLHLAERADSLADLSGRQIRMPGDLGAWGTALGIVPVSMPTGDIYQAGQKGIIDGAYSGPHELKNLQLAEIFPFTLDFPTNTGTFCTAITEEKWNSFPDDVKAVLESTSAWAAAEMGDRWDQQAAKGFEWAADLGHEMVEPSADELKKMLDALYAANKTVAASMEKDGRPGMAVLRAAEQAEQKWADQLLYPDYQYSE